MKIIDYNPKYAERIVDLCLISKRHALGDYTEPHNSADMLDYLTQIMAVEQNVLLGIEADKLVGFMTLRKNWIEQLYIDVAHLNQGLGSQFMARAKQSSPTILHCYTFERNLPARAFYEKHGFVAIEFGSENEENLPDILYKWQV